MAKQAMVTRTIITTKAEIMCLDIEQAEPYNDVILLPRTYKDDKAVLKAATAIIDDDNHKAVHVVRTEVIETLYGMTEIDFIRNAQVLPERKTKTNAIENTVTNATDN